MPVNVADLQARLSLDVAQFQRGLQNAQRELKGFQGLVDAYGRQVTTTAVGQQAFQVAVEQTGRKFQTTGREIAQATRATRALAGSLASEVNPALGETISALSLAARATQGFGVALTAMSIGLAAVVTGAILFIRHMKEAAARQKEFNAAIRTGDVSRLAGEFQKVNDQLEQLSERAQGFERLSPGTRRFLFGGLAELHAPGTAREEIGEQARILRERELGAQQEEDLRRDAEEAARIIREQIVTGGRTRGALTDIERAMAFERQWKELMAIVGDWSSTVMPSAIESTLALTSALGDFDLAAARANEQTKETIEAIILETIRLEDEARTAVDEWAVLARTIEMEVSRGFTVGEQAVRGMTVELDALRLELIGDTIAADEARIAFDLFGRTLEELTSAEREQVDRLARIKNEMRELVQLHDDVIQVFASVGQAIDRMVQGVIMGTQTMAEAFNNFFRNIAAQLASNIIRSLLRPVEEALAAMVMRLLTTQITVGGTVTTIGAALGGAAGPAGVVAGGALGGQTGQMLTALGAAASITRGASALSGTGAAGMQGVFGGAAGLGAGLGVGGGILSLAGMFIPGTAGRVVSGLGGAMSGASLGMYIGSLAGPIGTVVGGILGAIVGGLFGGGFLGDLFGGGKRKRDIRAISAAEGAAGAAALSQAIAGARSPQELVAILNQPWSPFRQVRPWLGTPTPGAPIAGSGWATAWDRFIQPQAFIDPGEGIGEPITLQHLLDPTLRAFVASGEVGVLSLNQAVTEQLQKTIEAFREFGHELERVLLDLEHEAVALRAGIAEDSQEILHQQVAAFKTLLASLTASAQGQLDAARVELLTLTDPEKILQQADRVHRLIVERYAGELDLIRAVVNQVQELASAWAAVTAGVSQQILGLQTGSFSTLQPAEIFGLTRGRFREAITGFRAAPTPEAGAQVSVAANMWLEAAAQIFDRPSREFQAIFAEVLGGLREVELEGLERQADFESVIQELLGEGNTLESIIAENTARMADALDALREELRSIFEGLGFLPALQGGGVVMRTGAAIVHAGEEVIPAAERAGALVLEAGAVVVQGATNVDETVRRVLAALERSMRGSGRLRFVVQRAVGKRR